MEHTDFDGIIFADTLQDFNALRHTGRVIHILCSGGNMGFTFQDTRYHIAAGDYVILPNATLGSDFSDSGDFQGIFMSLSDLFITSIAIRSNYANSLIVCSSLVMESHLLTKRMSPLPAS